MDIEFIKWMCDKAEGFGINRNDVIFVNHSKLGATCGTVEFDYVIYPLLLQRAIEGVNRGTDYEIISNEGLIIYFKGCKSEDQAKESSLKYIYEQEEKK